MVTKSTLNSLSFTCFNNINQENPNINCDFMMAILQSNELPSICKWFHNFTNFKVLPLLNIRNCGN